MCNNISLEDKILKSTSIPYTGHGYKIFKEVLDLNGNIKNIAPMCDEHHYYDNDNITIVPQYKKYIKWIGFTNRGFCFFKNRKIANHMCLIWNGVHPLPRKERYKIYCIEYKGGMQTKWEDHFIHGMIIEVSICKEFRLANKQGEY